MDPRIDEVLAFWFGDGSDTATGRWYKKDAAFDAEIRDRFGALHAEAAEGGLDTWRATLKGELALVVVLDQLSRNLFRDDPRAFACDPRALAISQDLVGSGRLRQLGPLEQMIALMPFEHSEDLAMQRIAVEQFVRLVAENPGHALLASGEDYARRHAVVIERFGRFPHRNAVLGRASTPEELAFLEQPGSRF